MLKITTLLISTFFITNINAQIKKGALILGGQIGVNTWQTSKSSSPLINPSPGNQYIKNNSSNVGLNIGTAFSENKVIGLDFMRSNTKESVSYQINDTGFAKSNLNELGAYYRQYKKIANGFYFYGQVNVSSVFGKGSRSYNFSAFDQDTKQSGVKLFLTAGVAYAITKKLQLELALPSVLGLQSTKTKTTTKGPNASNEEINQFNFYSSSSNNNALGNVGVGFRIIL